MTTARAQTVEDYRASLDPAVLAMVDSLRAIVAGSHEGLSERIKWNAPSFAIDGDDRITLGLDCKGGVRVVLHRGAKSKDSADFQFEDRAGLARWAASDRGVIAFQSLAEIEARRVQLSELCRNWLIRTG